MRVVDLIHEKRLGKVLSQPAIRDLVRSYVNGDIPDYQMSAFAMAVVLRGMNDEETTALTLAMAESGHVMDWSDIPGTKVDKHSTGGVGDTTTLVLAPLVASVGVPIAKMSGRGLGHTGGTIDKLESIPGFDTQLAMDAFKAQVREMGVAIAAQTADLAPADKKLYALRDVTDTVESIPLIASSIMSKKLASGADAIVLDVKVGGGAFMKDLSAARKLAESMVAIGTLSGRRTVAVLTRMDEPLGHAVGNALEVREAITTLRGVGPTDLTDLCLTLGAEMVVQSGVMPNIDDARQRLQQAIDDGSALAKFKDLIARQGGDPRVCDDLSLLPKAPVIQTFTAPSDGVIEAIDAEAFGLVAMRLGAGRSKSSDTIDPAVGLLLHRKLGQPVVCGEVVVEVHASSAAEAEDAVAALSTVIRIAPGNPFDRPLVLDVVRATQNSEDGQATASADGLAVVRPADGKATVRAADGKAAEQRGDKSARDTREAELPDENLVMAAQGVLERAYVPYSRFQVGAALRFKDGRVVTGCNVENASYGLTNCAERTAVFRAIAEGVWSSDNPVEAIAVIADSEGPVAPCGACRQVLSEFCAPETLVILSDCRGNRRRTSVAELLPYSFGAFQIP